METEYPVFEREIGKLPYARFLDVHLSTENLRRFASGGHHPPAFREFPEQTDNVCGFHHFEEFIRSIVFRSANYRSRIV